MFCFHIINQSENALLASQSEEVTTSSQLQVVDPPVQFQQTSGRVTQALYLKLGERSSLYQK